MAEENKNKDLAPEDKIMVDKKTWNAVLKRLERLEEGKEPEVPYAESVEENVVRIRKLDGKYVVGIVGKVWREWDEKTKDYRDKVKLLLTKDGKEGSEKTVDYLEFLRHADFVNAKVIDRKRKTIVKREGMVEVKKVEDYRTVGTGVRVPLEEISYDETLTVELPDGKKLKIKSDFVNL